MTPVKEKLHQYEGGHPKGIIVMFINSLHWHATKYIEVSCIVLRTLKSLVYTSQGAVSTQTNKSIYELEARFTSVK